MVLDDLTPSPGRQQLVWLAVRRHPGARLSEIAVYAGLSVAQTARAIVRLQGLGFVYLSRMTGYTYYPTSAIGPGGTDDAEN